jgi:hypothetical protein
MPGIPITPTFSEVTATIIVTPDTPMDTSTVCPLIEPTPEVQGPLPAVAVNNAEFIGDHPAI